jgi:hypothetical protein
MIGDSLLQALRGTSISWNVSASTDIRFVTALVSRENERRPIAGRRTGLMHVSLLGWLSPFACALR